MEVLQAADKETVEAQKKKMHSLMRELDELKQKYGQLKRNYDSVSLHAKKDAENNQKVLEMKAAFQKEISELTSAKLEAETELKEVKASVSGLESKNRE